MSASERRTRQVLVVQGLVIQDNRILMIQRREPSIPKISGNWELPGGKLNYKDSPAQAVAREMLEETGYIVEPLGLIDAPYATIRKPKNQPQFQLVSFAYHCRLVEGERARPKASPKVAAIDWFPLDHLDVLKIQSGSLGFIETHLQAQGRPPLRAQPIPSRASIELSLADKSANANRYYSINIQGRLLEGTAFIVTRSWGRGAPTNCSVAEFTSRDKMLSFVRGHLVTRRSHGYTLERVSESVPADLRADLESFPKSERPQEQPSLFCDDRSSERY